MIHILFPLVLQNRVSKAIFKLSLLNHKSPFLELFINCITKKSLKKTHKQTSQPRLVTLFCSKTSKRLKNCGLLTCRFSDLAFHHLMMDRKIILEPWWQQQHQSAILFHQRIGKHKLRNWVRLKKRPPAIPLDYTRNVSFQTWPTLPRKTLKTPRIFKNFGIV